MYVIDHMQGLVKPAMSFLVQSHHELQNKNDPKKYTLRTITPRGNPLGQSIKHAHSSKSSL